MNIPKILAGLSYIDIACPICKLRVELKHTADGWRGTCRTCSVFWGLDALSYHYEKED